MKRFKDIVGRKDIRSVISLFSIVCSLLLNNITVTQDAIAQNLGAQDAGKLEIGGQLGGMIFQGDAKYDPGHLFSGARLGYFLTKELSAEAAIVAGSADVRRISNEDADILLPTVEAQYHLNDSLFKPFVAGGIGVLSVSGPNDIDGSRLVFPVGGGVKWFLSKDLALRADARYIFNTEGGDEQHMGSYTAGFSWFFGGPNTVIPKPVDTTKPALKEHSPPIMPEAARALERGEKVKINLQVQFDTDSSTLKSQYVDKMRQFAAFMDEHPDSFAEIEGHTDSKGSEKHNQKLSQERAEAVRIWLIKEGNIAASRVSAKGYGQSKPLVSNSDPEGRARNRRVIGALRKKRK